MRIGIQTVVYFLSIIALTVFSFGFSDPNIVLSTHPVFDLFHTPLFYLVYHMRPAASGIFIGCIIILTLHYLWILGHSRIKKMSISALVTLICITAAILVFSYPAFTHDLFNYMTTAKVLYTYGENPYVVMPIEIPDEPYLAFTRAANKYALYGPVWLLLTALPHVAGNGSVWLTIISFKLLGALTYLFMAYVIYRLTRSVWNVCFFAFNPLVLIEILVSGHNDLAMMIPAILGLVLWQKNRWQQKFTGVLLFISSWLVKGATVVLTPVLGIKNISREKLFVISYCLLLIVFFIAAPIREELYPWYFVWLISVCALLPLATYRFLYFFTIILSVSLEFRHVPYMWMGYYEGVGPWLRMLFTLVPVSLFLLYWFVYAKKKI